MEHTSLWLGTSKQTNYPALKKDCKTDVLIIGGGLVGVILGYFLAKQGIDFLIVEMRQVGSGVSGHSTAKITYQHGLAYSGLIKNLGETKASLYANANKKAIELYEKIINDLSIDCDFKKIPNYIYSLSQKERTQIENEIKTALKLELDASFSLCEWLPFTISGAVKITNQARFHPVKFIQNLANFINKDGAKIYENTPVRDLEYEKGLPKAKTDFGTIQARKVVIATNYPFKDPDEYFMKLMPRQSYAVAADIDNKLPLGMYISTEKDFHSFRPHPLGNKEIWIFGGGLQRVAQVENTDQKYKDLKTWANKNFKVNKVFFEWTTHDLKTFDNVPMVGIFDKKYPHIFIATGFKGWGITNTMAAAYLLQDLIQGRENPWSHLYDPLRKSTLFSAKLINYNVPTIAKLVSERIKKYPPAFENLKSGEGDIFEINKEKIAVYKDEKNKIHLNSAKCTHMGCIVHFNKAEKSWDCPCHGSRFDSNGEIIHAPASKKLEQKTL